MDAAAAKIAASTCRRAGGGGHGTQGVAPPHALHRSPACRSVEEAITSKVRSKKARTRLLNLYSGYERQAAVNEDEFLSVVGEAIIYGQVVQLRHMASGKFVTIRRTAAEVERGALQVVLEDGGMEGSWFQVFSGYRWGGVGAQSRGVCVCTMGLPAQSGVLRPPPPPSA